MVCDVPKEQKLRAPLNGAPVEFGLLWLNGDFFIDGTGTTRMIEHPAAQLAPKVAEELNARKQLYEVGSSAYVVEDKPELMTGPAPRPEPMTVPATSTGLQDLEEDKYIPVPMPSVMWSSVTTTGGRFLGKRK
jgi:hypothetical protein